MNKENKISFDILLELVLGYKKHTDKMYEWVDNLKAENKELREALGKPVCIAKKPKPRTNFEKITENVESLAEFLSNTMICDDCPIRLQSNTCKCSPSSPCPKIIKEWLQKESE